MKFIFVIMVVQFITNAETLLLPRNCDDVKIAMELIGLRALSSGVFPIYPAGKESQPTEVFCDMDTGEGGWIVIQRRKGTENQIDFFRNWTEYSKGFGALEESFWLGLETISILTNTNTYRLRIDMIDWEDEERYAEYEFFRVGNASENFKLTVEGFSGNAGDSLMYHNGRPFSTLDNDNDDMQGSDCALGCHGAWWYGACHNSNLNGLYGSTEYAKGIIWLTWRGDSYSLKSVEMKIRTV